MKERQFRTFAANFVIVAVLALTFGVAIAVSAPAGDGGVQAANTAIYAGNSDGDSVSLMFNVYENAANVIKIADILSEYGFKATFFVGGSWAAKNGDTLLRLQSDGFEIGNHGYMHRDHAKLTYKQNVDEITVTEKLIDVTLSDIPDYKNSKLFAPPSGSIGENMFKACADNGFKVIMWTRDTIDWRDHDADLIYKRAIRDVKAGDLVLMHPTDCTVAALPKVLEHLRSLSLKADTVSNTIK